MRGRSFSKAVSAQLEERSGTTRRRAFADETLGPDSAG